MNERMKTLCQNAFQEVHESRVGTDGLIRTDGNPYIFYEKFAELIVKECASIVADAVDQREPASTYVDKIKQHFGVEE
jgi:hypothetical protein